MLKSESLSKLSFNVRTKSNGLGVFTGIYQDAASIRKAVFSILFFGKVERELTVNTSLLPKF